jgi:DNA-binding response OmpR family regulator
MSGSRILIICEEQAAMPECRPELIHEGFQVDQVAPGLDAIRRILTDSPDLVILGMKPREEAWQFCRQLLTFSDKPLLVLLSGNDRLDRTKGLELGADDCMIKPILQVELIARVRALLRRNAAGAYRTRQSFFEDGDLVIDLGRREVRLDGRPVRLTPTELRFLWCLVMHAGEVLSHERLSTQVWGAADINAKGSIKLYVHQLRQKLEPDPRHPQRIVTRRGEGYMFQRLQRG